VAGGEVRRQRRACQAHSVPVVEHPIHLDGVEEMPVSTVERALACVLKRLHFLRHGLEPGA
jgi:hypothetical protein